MDIIIFPRTNGKSYCIRCFQWHHLLLILAVVLAVPMGTAAVGYYAGIRFGHESVVQNWREDVLSQKQKIEMAREEMQASVNAMARKMGQLQAHVNRLDALGYRLVKMADLDETEFDFRSEPGLGGPADSGEDQRVIENEISTTMDRLAAQLAGREQQLQVLDRLIMTRSLNKEILPSGRPINKGWLSSAFGRRNDPFTGKREFHKGMDFAGKEGSDIYAVAGGVVTWAGKRHGYGFLVELDHGGRYTTRYGHAKALHVKVGDVVKKGQIIASMGNTGRSTGPHVHFEVLKDGKPINPSKFISASR